MLTAYFELPPSLDVLQSPKQSEFTQRFVQTVQRKLNGKQSRHMTEQFSTSWVFYPQPANHICRGQKSSWGSLLEMMER